MNLLHFRLSLIISLLIFVINMNDAFCQKVAVVLSGGGSRGAAHVGVLKALEENNIPIDYIIGTSIGAFVGGLYAAGYSPEEIEKLLTSAEVKRWSSGAPNPNYNYFYKKGDPNASWITLDFDFNKSLSKILPSNLVSTTEMDFTLMSLFAGPSAASGQNFDSLFIPFRCVAADIDASQAITLATGDLGKAVRASLTFPLFFKPLRIDGRLLFDGGMYNNFPHDVANEVFKPDVIIGSKVSKNYPSPDPDDVVSQIQKMLMTDADFNLSVENGIIIEPDLVKPNLTDFSLAEEFISIAYQETLQKIPEIKAKISNFRTPEEVNENRNKFKDRMQPLFIDSVNTVNKTKNEAVYLNKIFFHQYQTVTLKDVEPGYYNVATDRYFELGMPSLTLDRKSQKYFLDLDLKKADRFNILFGGNLSSRLANMAFVELNYKYLFTQGLKLKTNVYFGRFYTSFLLGFRLESPSKTPFYLDGNLVYNHFNYFKSDNHFFGDVTPSYLIENENFARVTGGIPTSIKGKLEAGITVGSLDDNYYQTNQFSREDTADVTKFRFTGGGLSWELNSLNRKLYPNSGSRFVMEGSLVSGRESFYSGSLSTEQIDNEDIKHDWVRLRIVWENYFKRIGRLKLGFYGELSLSNQEFFTNYTSSLLVAPAFLQIPESKTTFLPNYRAHNYGVGGLTAILILSRNVDVRLENYLFQPYQQILRDADNQPFYGEKFVKRYFMGSAAVVYQTFLGPISFSVNYFDNPENKVFFALNIGYLIFNKRALY